MVNREWKHLVGDIEILKKKNTKKKWKVLVGGEYKMYKYLLPAYLVQAKKRIVSLSLLFCEEHWIQRRMSRAILII